MPRPQLLLISGEVAADSSTPSVREQSGDRVMAVRLDEDAEAGGAKQMAGSPALTR